MHVSRYKQWEVLPASKFSGKWFKFAVGNELLESFIIGTQYTEEQLMEYEKQGYQIIDIPLEMLHRFEMDMNRTLIDTCGIAVQSSYKYIPYKLIQPCIGMGSNPFQKEILKIGLKDKYQIKDFFIPELVPEIIYTKKIYIHCDLSKSGDMTGISAVAVLGYKNQERFDNTGEANTLKEIVFRHVFSVGLQCPPNDELSMIKVKDFLHYLKFELGWNIVGVSCDGYQSLMLLQSLKIDGFDVKEVSMDIVSTKTKECVGYTIFRNTLVEQRIKLLNLYELIREITNLEKNEATGRIDHPKQTTRVLDDGTRVKSVGKDISDSLGGAIYNATLSVNLDELDFLDGVTIADSSVMLNNSASKADQFFGISTNADGSVRILPRETSNIDEQLSVDVQKEIKRTQGILQQVKATNPTTKLSDQEILDLYGEMDSNGFVIF